ncbi:hypothetical protein ACFY3J_37470, partial [Streptomyces sp. NPDC001231]|uniref:hypothetical protein n=1 Tax=Streptomyces sp. NPDC001231 TaxID=3364549 RepID=UPI0036AB10AD
PACPHGTRSAQYEPLRTSPARVDETDRGTPRCRRRGPRVQGAEIVENVVEGVLVGLLPGRSAQLLDEVTDFDGAEGVRVVLHGAGEGTQGVGELDGDARVLIEQRLDETIASAGSGFSRR